MFSTTLKKYAQVNLDPFSQNRDEHKNIFELPPPIGIWGFPKMVIPNNHGVFLLKMIILGWRLGVPPFKETPISTRHTNIHVRPAKELKRTKPTVNLPRRSIELHHQWKLNPNPVPDRKLKQKHTRTHTPYKDPGMFVCSKDFGIIYLQSYDWGWDLDHQSYDFSGGVLDSPQGPKVDLMVIYRGTK